MPGASNATANDEGTKLGIKILAGSFAFIFVAFWLISCSKSASARKEEKTRILNSCMHFFPETSRFDLLGDFKFRSYNQDFESAPEYSYLLVELSGPYEYKNRKRVYAFLCELNNSIYFLNQGSKISMGDPVALHRAYNEAKEKPSLLIELPELDKRALFALRQYEEFYDSHREEIEREKRKRKAEIDEIAHEKAEREQQRKQQLDDLKARKFQEAWDTSK